jgi:hypothetical protein
MMFLCGIDADGQPSAINITDCRTISLVSYDDGDVIFVEFSDIEIVQSVEAEDATICTPQRVAAVLMSLKERKR